MYHQEAWKDSIKHDLVFQFLSVTHSKYELTKNACGLNINWTLIYCKWEKVFLYAFSIVCRNHVQIENIFEMLAMFVFSFLCLKRD